MAELREVFEMVTRQTEPDLDSWKEQEARHRRTSRNRKVGAIALVAALIVGVLAFVTVTLPGDGENGTPADPGRTTPEPDAAIPTRGAQIVGLDGSVRQRIPGLGEDAFGLELSPDGSTIAFMTGDIGSGRVAMVRTDGSGLAYLTDEGENANRGDAQNAVSWSPDGTMIAYASSGNIYVMNADGSNRVQLTTAAGEGQGSYYPAWSPDGTTIAFWQGSANGIDGGPRNGEIYTIPVAGGTPTRLTDNDVSDIEPAWSPDGSRIAFWNGAHLSVMNADGTNQHELGYLGALGDAAWAPDWSPDGRRIAVLRFDGNPFGLALMEVVIVDLQARSAESLGMRVGTDLNGVDWISSDTLLINRYD